MTTQQDQERFYMEPIEHAAAVHRSAKRLLSLMENKAPAVVIESERQLLLRNLIALPVDPAAQRAVEEQRNQIHREEQDHLLKTGYFDDAIRALEESGDE